MSDDDALPVVDYQFWAEVDGSPWLVREIDVREALSGEFVARIDLENDDPTADPGALLGAKAALTLSRPTTDGLARSFGGVVRAVDEPWGADQAGRRRCRVALEPAFACLKEQRLTRKFQGLTVPEVVRAVLGQWGDAFEREHELRLARESESPSSGRGFATRDLCVQYDETTYDFLRRILAEEGLTYFFEQADGDAREKLVIVDDNGGFPEAPDPFPLRPAHGAITSSEAVRGLSVTRGRSATKTRASLFNLTNHQLVAAETGADGGADIDLGGRGVTLFGYDDKAYVRDDAAVQARLGLERSAVAAIVGRGAGDIIGFWPGLVVTLVAEDALLPEAADKLLLVSVRHRGGDPERLARGGDRALPYENEFTFVPAATPFRPALVPKPVAVEDWGVVVSASDTDPIYTDRHGRVRVRFGYDLDESTPAERRSPWIPVAQAWAGVGYGVQIIPRAGMVVRLRYLFGDPDRPLVVGCLPTGNNVLPSPPPEEKTRTTIRTRTLRRDKNGLEDLEHYNEITLDDAANREEVYIHAGRNYRRKVLHDELVEIDHDERRAVAGQQTLEVRGARHKTVHQDENVTVRQVRETTIAGDDRRHVQGSDRLTVEKDQKITIGGTRTTTVQNLDSGDFLAGRSERVQGDDELHVSENLTTIADKKWEAKQGPTTLALEEGNVTLGAGGNITLEVNGAVLRMESGGKAVLECNDKISILCGSSSIVVSPDKIEIAAPEVQLTGTNGAVKLDRSGATTTGLTVTSSAMTTNEITGAFVKAN